MAKLVDTKHLDELIAPLMHGEIVGFPTETVYGLAIGYHQFSAFLKLAELKQRPITKPITAMVADVEKITSLAIVNKKQEKIIQHFMPGSLTIVLNAKENLPAHVTLQQKTIGIRIPSNFTALEILKKVNLPLLVTSANLSSLPPLVKWEEVYQNFSEKMAVIVMEDSLNQEASTVVDLTQEEPVLLRKGPIDFADILRVWREN